MARAPGARLGGYDIVDLIGAGGMGEVYRARDTRLNRDVAIKVLPDAFSADPERLSRFEQEARAAAALNHPNIVAVFDLGTEGNTPFVVSELLEGETLRDRLSAGPLPVRKAIEYGVQIARGLAAAHGKGIVHRDLKPENIFVTADGRIKILDFGLAKLTQTDSPLVAGTNVPTTPFAAQTQVGMVLGTVGYMAPEQVRGQAVDHRADFFAFGAILYEMLSGRRAFQGETTIDAMTAILKEDPPDLPAVERHIPPALERIVDRCLEKNPIARFQTASDLVFALEGLSTRSETTGGAKPPLAPAWPRRLLADARVSWAIAAVLALALVSATTLLWRRSLPTKPKITFELAAPATVLSLQTSVSPEGTHLIAASGLNSPLWLRSLDRLDGRLLPGTDGGLFPFWSPDGRFIGFFSGGKLKKVDILGTPPQTLADAPIGRGGSWGRDNSIVFAPNVTGPLFRVSAEGGTPIAITELDETRQETGHWHPQLLPDSRHFIFLAYSSKPENTGIAFGSLDAKTHTRLVPSQVKALFAPPDHLLFVRETTVMAQAFDAPSGVLTGDPVAVASPAGANTTNGAAGFAVSENGLLAYRSGTPGAIETSIRWIDRSAGILAPSHRTLLIAILDSLPTPDASSLNAPTTRSAPGISG